MHSNYLIYLSHWTALTSSLKKLIVELYAVHHDFIVHLIKSKLPSVGLVGLINWHGTRHPVDD